MSEQPAPEKSKIIPNSFQTPNVLVDEYMKYLTGNEIKCYLVIDRKTLGWLKQRDRISISQIKDITGLNMHTARDCMRELTNYGLCVKTADNDPTKNEGDEYALQTDDSLINLEGLINRGSERKAKSKQIISKARAALNNQGEVLPPAVEQQGLLSDSTPPPAVQQPTQKPFKAKELNDNDNGLRPNIFKLYEKNIGAITPLLVDGLIDAEKTYPPDWIDRAFRVAVENNARNWTYIKAVLKNMQIHGVDWKPAGPAKGKSNGQPPRANNSKTLTEPTEADMAAARRILAARENVPV